MGKSARVLGSEFGRTAREMNALLKDYGYLRGEPGAYGLTEKGQQYGVEHYNENGYGGYAARSWETRTWKDGLADALRADMAAHPGGLTAADSAPDVVTYDIEAEGVAFEPDHYDDSPRMSDRQATVVVWAAVVVGAVVLAAPFVKPFWDNKVQPAARKIRKKFTKQETPEIAPAEPVEDRPGELT